MEPLLKIVKAGVFLSLQDGGRFGYRRFGIPVSGPMDRLSHELGNYIVGNRRDSLSLELFRGGFVFQALRSQTYVLTGADGQYLLNGAEIESWKTFDMHAGDELVIRETKNGQIVYLSVAGGFTEQEVLGSCSDYRPANIGRELVVDALLYGERKWQAARTKGLYRSFVPPMKQSKVRVYKGAHFDLFDEASKWAFFETAYRFQGGNRMGYFLQGHPLSLEEPKNLLSEATLFGTIQVPTSGQPIILMADAQTIGGYPVIATVHPDDLRLIAQMNVYDEVQFELVEV